MIASHWRVKDAMVHSETKDVYELVSNNGFELRMEKKSNFNVFIEKFDCNSSQRNMNIQNC